MRTVSESPVPALKRVQTIAAGSALFGCIGLIAAFFMNRNSFYASFMFAWVFWGGLSIGAMTLTFLHHTIRAAWSLSILRMIEAANKTMLVMGLIFCAVMIPSVLLGTIYQWTDAEVVAGSELLQRKTFFLNKTGYCVSTIFFFAFWVISGIKLNASSRLQDTTKQESLGQSRTNYSAPLGVVHVILLTFAVTYWIMSLDPAWFSTIYGVWFMIQEMRCMIAVGAVVLLSLRFTRPFNTIVTANVSRDLGWMLIGLSMFWAYVSLSQFLIIWAANLPEEITYYINRFNGWLVYVGAFLIVAQFLMPFLALLSYNVKRSPEKLLPIAVWIAVISALDIWWQITPFFRVGMRMEHIWDYALDFGAFAGIGGIWVWLFCQNLIGFAKDGALVPAHDTRLVEAKIAEMGAHHA